MVHAASPARAVNILCWLVSRVILAGAIPGNPHSTGFSPEAIDTLYTEILGREADLAGLEHYTAVSSEGVGVAQVNLLWDCITLCFPLAVLGTN